MRERAKELAARVAAEQKAVGFTRYSLELRAALVSGVQAARESGTSVSWFARSTGVSVPSLYGWLRASQSFVRVRMQGSQRPALTATLTVVDAASGVRVKGCTVEHVAALMRTLRG
jgi:transposase-like protein